MIITHTPISNYRRSVLADPTRTQVIRGRFVADVDRRFNELLRYIRIGIVDEDCFGLRPDSRVVLPIYQLTSPGRRAFDFPRIPRKVGAFMSWLQRQQDKGILELVQAPIVGSGIERAWTNTYIESAYKKGVIRAYTETKKKGYSVPNIEDTGGYDFLLSHPSHADRAGVIYTRAFNELKGITATMDTQVSTILSQGLIDGKGPVEIARMLRKVVSGRGADLGITDRLGRYIPAKRRAEILARTEVIRAHHQATIQQYRNFGVVGVHVQAEWITVGDDRVCDECLAMAAREEPYTLDEVEPLIPLHPL